MTWRPSDLLPSKVFRQCPHESSRQRARRDNLLPMGFDGFISTDAEHVQSLMAQARLVDECASASQHLPAARGTVLCFSPWWQRSHLASIDLFTAIARHSQVNFTAFPLYALHDMAFSFARAPSSASSAQHSELYQHCCLGMRANS
jgi:hypothetical protein